MTPYLILSISPEVIDLSSNIIDKVRLGFLFLNTRSMRLLDLSHNQITLIDDASAVRYISQSHGTILQLRKLLLQYNKITFLSVDMFYIFHKLVLVDLSFNNISVVSSTLRVPDLCYTIN